jgi:hypothetical protein
MWKNVTIAGVAAGTAVLVAGSVGPAVGSGGDGHGGNGDHRGSHSFTVISTQTESSFVDVGATDESLGDQFVFTSALTRHGRDVGHAGVVCTVTSVKTEEVQCAGSLWFDGRGEVTIQGLLVGEQASFSFPITGGQGSFEGAEGTLYVKDLTEQGDVERLTISLVDSSRT